MRESPSLKIFENLEINKIKCDFYDPYVTEIKDLRKFDKIKKSIKLTARNIRKYNLIILATDHDQINYVQLKNNSAMIFDCRGRFSRLKSKNIKQI